MYDVFLSEAAIATGQQPSKLKDEISRICDATGPAAASKAVGP